MIPSERVRELEIEIHNTQPHLDRVVVCLRAITAYLDEASASPSLESLKKLVDRTTDLNDRLKAIETRPDPPEDQSPGQCVYCQMLPSGHPCPEHAASPKPEAISPPPLVLPALPLKPETK